MVKRNYRVERFYADVGAFRIHSQSITGSGRLTQRFLEDSETIFRKATGRERGPFDRLVTGPLLRGAARLFDPVRSLDLAKDRIRRVGSQKNVR
jgi:hypothetical protein